MRQYRQPEFESDEPEMDKVANALHDGISDLIDEHVLAGPDIAGNSRFDRCTTAVGILINQLSGLTTTAGLLVSPDLSIRRPTVEEIGRMRKCLQDQIMPLVMAHMQSPNRSV